MIDTRAQSNTTHLLDAIARAYARGDTPLAELLFGRALDDDLPWNEVCAAAARGVSQRFGEHARA